MKKTKISKIFSSIASEFVILWMPQILSLLHLASYYTYKKVKEREKRLNELSKKMIIIAKRLETIEEEKEIAVDSRNYIKLFYRVYEQLDRLTLRELGIIRDFCYALYNPYDLTITRGDGIEREEDIYYQYKSVLDDVIEEMEKERKLKKRRICGK